MSDYTHDDAMRDLNSMFEKADCAESMDADAEFDRLAAHIERLEEENAEYRRGLFRMGRQTGKGAWIREVGDRLLASLGEKEVHHD